MSDFVKLGRFVTEFVGENNTKFHQFLQNHFFLLKMSVTHYYPCVVPALNGKRIPWLYISESEITFCEQAEVDLALTK